MRSIGSALAAVAATTAGLAGLAGFVEAAEDAEDAVVADAVGRARFGGGTTSSSESESSTTGAEADPSLDDVSRVRFTAVVDDRDPGRDGDAFDEPAVGEAGVDGGIFVFCEASCLKKNARDGGLPGRRVATRRVLARLRLFLVFFGHDTAGSFAKLGTRELGGAVKPQAGCG